ncbi:hypothetical protein BESB_005790 [Besnoitia besnoiti]|uniref:LEM3/CDC50 family protein n=1 Tax=Besnoitia besnoiti TaxID=94643 RepID=A0A2A9MI72_BESBE|nr:hypothetical protein BESB_005790 [Besnoitia besnoiti]PFH38238.1 hypothetical protein BESB_005790 [Besnoitia besnoiti]
MASPRTLVEPLSGDACCDASSREEGHPSAPVDSFASRRSPPRRAPDAPDAEATDAGASAAALAGALEPSGDARVPAGRVSRRASSSPSPSSAFSPPCSPSSRPAASWASAKRAGRMRSWLEDELWQRKLDEEEEAMRRRRQGEKISEFPPDGIVSNCVFVNTELCAHVAARIRTAQQRRKAREPAGFSRVAEGEAEAEARMRTPEEADGEESARGGDMRALTRGDQGETSCVVGAEADAAERARLASASPALWGAGDQQPASEEDASQRTRERHEVPSTPHEAVGPSRASGVARLSSSRYASLSCQLPPFILPSRSCASTVSPSPSCATINLSAACVDAPCHVSQAGAFSLSQRQDTGRVARAALSAQSPAAVASSFLSSVRSFFPALFEEAVAHAADRQLAAAEGSAGASSPHIAVSPASHRRPQAEASPAGTSSPYLGDDAESDASARLPAPLRRTAKYRHRKKVKVFLSNLYQQDHRRSPLPFQLFLRRCTTLFCTCWGLLLVLLGFLVLFLSSKSHRVEIPYASGVRQKRFHVPERMGSPVYLYYRIGEFYGNYRPYIKDGPQSVSTSYVCHEVKSQQEAVDFRTFNGTLTLPSLLYSVNGERIPPDSRRAFPCGLQSVSLFNDEFSVHRVIQGLGEEEISISTEDVAYHWDFTRFMLPNSTWETVGAMPWILPSNERFRVWIHPPFTPAFQKLYGVLHTTLEPGQQYFLRFSDSSWPAEQWRTTKAIVLVTLAPIIGGANYPLGYFCIAAGGLCLFGVVLLWLFHCFGVRLTSSTVKGTDMKAVIKQAEEDPSEEEAGAHAATAARGDCAGGKAEPLLASAERRLLEGADSAAARSFILAHLPRPIPCLCPAHCPGTDVGLAASRQGAAKRTGRKRGAGGEYCAAVGKAKPRSFYLQPPTTQPGRRRRGSGECRSSSSVACSEPLAEEEESQRSARLDKGDETLSQYLDMRAGNNEASDGSFQTGGSAGSPCNVSLDGGRVRSTCSQSLEKPKSGEEESNEAEAAAATETAQGDANELEIFVDTASLDDAEAEDGEGEAGDELQGDGSSRANDGERWIECGLQSGDALELPGDEESPQTGRSRMQSSLGEDDLFSE